MRKLIVIAHTSIEGLVAGPKGEFDNFLGGGESLEFVCSVTESGDAILMGRISYQLLDSHWPGAANKPGATSLEKNYSNWYNSVPKYVLSKTLQQGSSGNTTIISDDIIDEVNRIKQQPGKNILVFGSPTAVHSLLELNLIDGFWLLIHPVMFGEGIPLFKDKKKVNKLELVSADKLSNGIVTLNYEMTK